MSLFHAYPLGEPNRLPNGKITWCLSCLIFRHYITQPTWMLATYSKFYSHRKYSPLQHDLVHEENTLQAPSTTPHGHQTYSSTNNTYFTDRHQTISHTLHGYLSLYTQTTVDQFHHYCIIISYYFII